MNKKLLKNISVLLATFAVILLANTAYSAPNSIITYNPVEVTITSQSFVFKESFGSIEDDFTDVFAEVENFLRQNGAISTRKAILYLDYGVDKINPNMPRISAINQTRPLIDYLTETYGESTLNTHRRVLVGYLVPPQFYISPADPFKEYTFSNIKALAFQSMDKNVKTPLSVLTAPIGTQVPNEESTYTKSERLYDKLAMMNYLALHVEFSNNIGMMEMYDERLDVYTFMAIPGNQASFIASQNISASVAPGTFPRRGDVNMSSNTAQNGNGNNGGNTPTPAPEGQ